MTKVITFFTVLLISSCSRPTSTQDEGTSQSNGKNQVDTLTSIEYKAIKKGVKLESVIDFSKIKTVQIDNYKGVHEITNSDWQELQQHLMNSESEGGLLCKPQMLSLTMTFIDGNTLTGTICGNLINFENEIVGSFQLDEKVNFQNY